MLFVTFQSSRLLIKILILVGLASALSIPAGPSSAMAMDALGAYEQGAFEDAITRWSEEASAYEREGKFDKESEALTLSAQAYQTLGHYGKAFEALTKAMDLAERIGDQQRLAQSWAVAGNLYLAAGDLENAERYLNKALKVATSTKDVPLRAVIKNNLGNVFLAQQKPEEAVSAYRESLALALDNKDDQQAVRARINLTVALSQSGRFQEARAEADRGLSELGALADSYDKGSGFITLGRSYQMLHSGLKADDELLREAFSAFNQALEVAYKISNSREVSYALGYMGGLYESERRYEEALAVTGRAVQAGQQAVAPEALYQWHWQTARILKRLGRLDEAITAYRHAVQALESIRRDLAPSSARGQSFRESIGVLYFELADVLLLQTDRMKSPEAIEASLSEARNTIELFKGAELRDYFRDECVDAARSRAIDVEKASKNAVILYPISLPDRTDLLLSLQGELRRVTVPVTAERLTKEVRAFRIKLEKRTTRRYLPHAQQLYDWLIRPIAPLLPPSIDTLVIVPDGALRTIPFSALHDGNRFLIQQYAIATSPGLTLTDARPFHRPGVKANALSVGLTEAVQDFPSLPGVTTEIDAVQGFYPGKVLLNKEFVLSRLEEELKDNSFSIVHMASHGEFNNEVGKSFILTFDDKLTMDKLSKFVGLLRFRDDPLSLLTLSACETAAGDDRAALGLAGVAIKAGASSALASLWVINDDASSELVSEFYRQLENPTVSKAVALQRAQLKLFDDLVYQHPAYWSPFLLLSNWL